MANKEKLLALQSKIHGLSNEGIHGCVCVHEVEPTPYFSEECGRANARTRQGDKRLRNTIGWMYSLPAFSSEPGKLVKIVKIVVPASC